MPPSTRAIAFSLVFDAHSVAVLVEQPLLCLGDAVSRLWCQKHMDYSVLRSLSRCHKNCDTITEAATHFARWAQGLAGSSAAA